MTSISSSRLDTSIGGYLSLARLHNDLANQGAGVVEVDCSDVRWIDAHLASALSVIAHHANSRGQTLRLMGLSHSVSTILRKNNFLVGPLRDTYETTMPVTAFSLDEGVKFADYARRYLSHPSMPAMTMSLQRKFFEGVDELFANCSLHSQSKQPICVCGQFFPKKEILAFGISDGGHGMIGSYVKWSGQERRACDAIEWAMKEGNTSRVGDIPGGLGLALIREFIALNKGRLIVASDAGYWCQDGERVTMTDMRMPFPGTSIVMEIDCSDAKHYDEIVHASPDNIW